MTQRISAAEYLAETGAPKGGPTRISSPEYRRWHGLDPPQPKGKAKKEPAPPKPPPTQAQLLAQSVMHERQTLIVNVVIPWNPFAKQRARSGKDGGRHYTPAETRQATEDTRDVLRHAMGERAPYAFGPVDVHMEFWRENMRRRDADNLEKLLWDAANDIVWRDDSQVRGWRGRIDPSPVEPRTVFAVRPSRRPPFWRPCQRCGAFTQNTRFCGRACISRRGLGV